MTGQRAAQQVVSSEHVAVPVNPHEFPDLKTHSHHQQHHHQQHHRQHRPSLFQSFTQKSHFDDLKNYQLTTVQKCIGHPVSPDEPIRGSRIAADVSKADIKRTLFDNPSIRNCYEKDTKRGPNHEIMGRRNQGRYVVLGGGEREAVVIISKAGTNPGVLF